MVEHRLTTFHRVEAAFDHRSIDQTFFALPAEERDNPFDRGFPIVQEVFVANDKNVGVGRSRPPSGDVLEPGAVLQTAFDEQTVEILERALEAQIRAVEMEVGNENIQSIPLDVDVAGTIGEPFPRQVALENARRVEQIQILCGQFTDGKRALEPGRYFGEMGRVGLLFVRQQVQDPLR